MPNLPSKQKQQLIAIAKKHCSKYLDLQQQMYDSEEELPNDPYLIGMGLELGEENLEARLNDECSLVLKELETFIALIPSLVKGQELFALMQNNIRAFRDNPSQEHLNNFETKLNSDIDKDFPSASPVTTQRAAYQKLSIFNCVKKAQDEQYHLSPGITAY